MTDYTNNFSLPYPEGNDGVVVHTDIESLATRADQVVHSELVNLSQATKNRILSVETNVQETYGHLPDQVSDHDKKLNTVRQGDDNSLRVIDQAGHISFEVDQDGTTWLGDTQYRTSAIPFRVRDTTGQVALEIDSYGTTHIYNLAGGEGGSISPRITEWHVFLAVGQSNMSGAGLPYSAELDVEDPRFLQYGANTRSLQPATVPLDMHGPWVRGMSPATGFAQAYLRHQPAHVGVVLVPAARSGTAFTDGVNQFTWRPNTASAAEWDLYGQSVQQTREALEALDDRGHLKGILWHQGEGNSGMTTETYAAELDALITQYRTDLGDPELPLVVGQMAQERIASHATRWQVDRAHAQTPARVQRTGFAPSDWGWASYDETHFGRPGALGMGHRMVDAYWQAVANTNESQLLPPLNVTARRVGDTVTVTWDAPPTRVTGYQIRTRPIGGTTWDTVARDWPMHLSESFTATEPVEIEVTAHRDTETSTIVLTQA